MSTPRGSLRLTAALAFIAAALAWSAVAIRYARGRDVNWGGAAAGLLCFAWGISAWTRARQLKDEG